MDDQNDYTNLTATRFRSYSFAEGWEVTSRRDALGVYEVRADRGPHLFVGSGPNLTVAEDIVMDRLQALVGWNVPEHEPVTCPKCGMVGVAFICDAKGCPVNGGAAHG